MSRGYIEEFNVVYEGLTEKLLFDWLKKNFKTKNIWHGYDAKGCDKIISKFKKIKRHNNLARIIVMYDTDGHQTKDTILGQYEEAGLSISKEDIYLINYEIETLLLFVKSGNLFQNDRDITSGLKKYYGVENYRKTEAQINKIISQLNKDEFIRAISEVKNKSFTDYNVLFDELFIIPQKKKAR